ncbi:hypothetical protein Tco_1570009 [Tanacetum coccineum]
MSCSLPHTDSEVETLVQKLIDEDNGRQNAIMNLALQFETSCTDKDDLRKAYEKCNDISQESRALIDSFLKEGFDKDYELNLSMYGKAAKLEKHKDPKLAWLLEKYYYRSQESVGSIRHEEDETDDGPVDYQWTGELMEMMMMVIQSNWMTPMMRIDEEDEDDEEEEEPLAPQLYTALIDAVNLPALPPLPPLPPSLSIPSPVDRRDDIPESEQPPRKRLHLSTICSRYEIGESSTARPVRGQGIDYGFVSTVDAEERRQGIRDVGYGIRDTWVDPAEAVPEVAPMTMGEVNTRVVGLAELHERDTQDLYALLEDAQDGRSRISQRVEMNSQRVDLLMGDRMTLQETVWMVEEEAYASREAWAHSIGLGQATHQELQTHRDHVYAHETYLQAHQTQLQLQSTLIQTQHQVHETRFHMQQTEIAALRETDRRRQDQMVETLRVIRDMRREMSDMQAELLALREQRRRARQPGPEARIPDHQEASGDADSHI